MKKKLKGPLSSKERNRRRHLFKMLISPPESIEKKTEETI